MRLKAATPQHNIATRCCGLTPMFAVTPRMLAACAQNSIFFFI